MESRGATAEQSFGSRLREERDRRGWRQEDLAAHMARNGLTRHESFYAKIETGGTRIKLNEAVAIAGALGLSLSQMTTYVDQDKLTRELAQATEQVHQAQAELDHAQRSAQMAAMNYHRAVERRNDLLVILESAGRRPDPDARRS
jgi:transcriptional regulator with XRE-family HTH domain